DIHIPAQREVLRSGHVYIHRNRSIVTGPREPACDYDLVVYDAGITQLQTIDFVDGVDRDNRLANAVAVFSTERATRMLDLDDPPGVPVHCVEVFLAPKRNRIYSWHRGHAVERVLPAFLAVQGYDLPPIRPCVALPEGIATIPNRDQGASAG